MFVGLSLAAPPADLTTAPSADSTTARAVRVRFSELASMPTPGGAQRAQQRPTLSMQAQVGGMTLDFETGDLRGWTASGTAFNTQPTLGDNSLARGGQPANPQGDFWIGTFENHPRGSERAGTIQGDRPQGTLTSTTFDVPRGTLSFLVGGGSGFETRVELRVFDPIEGAIRVAFASGNNSETMRRETWELERWAGQRAQIWIIDASSGPWGHINVDDFRFSALQQPQLNRPLEIPQQELALPPQVARTRVPDLIGQSFDAAREMLAEARLEMGEVRRDPSSQPAGTVLQQDPPASTIVRVGTAVSVVVAAPAPRDPGYTAPPELAEVPDVVGRDVRAALEILRAGGLEGRLVDQRESSQTPGTVVTQAPTAGDRVAPGSVVELIEAIPVMAIVPALVGRSEAVARRLLEEAGLAAGRVGQRESSEPPARVLNQSAPPGTRLPQGSPVDFDVAVPEMRTVPDLIGQPEEEARRRIEAAELAVGAVVEAESRREPGTVVSQSERAGSRVVVGTPVDLVVTIPTTIEVPDLRGRSRPEAQGLLEGLELALGEVTTRESREPAGSVLSQRPAAGSRAEINTAVDVVVAEPVTVPVPDVVGRGEGNARQALSDFELAVGSTAPRESRQPTGTVLEQSIEAGTRVVIGTSVDLVVAEPVTVVVPEVVGLSEAEAAAAIEAAELVVGEAEYQQSAARPQTVLTQSLNPGTRVQIGSAVNLLVAVVETVRVPQVVGNTVEEARRALVTSRLAVGSEELQETRVETEGTVMEQSRAAGSTVAVGTSINLVVATPEIVVVPSLVGLTEEEAVAVITGLGLVVGAVAEQISTQAGGTVLEQAQPAGSQVVFGSPIAFEVARSRTIWAAPSALLLLVVAAGIAARMRSTKRRRSHRPTETPEEATLPHIHLRPVTDAGRQRIDDGADPVGGTEIRLRPRVDPGTQELQSPDDLIAGERREDE